MIVDGVRITAEGFSFDNPPPNHDEMKNYVDYVRGRVSEPVKSINVKLCEDGLVDVSYTARGEKFERIRRITGYLVGSIERWNDSKQAEERDRVKHEVQI